MSKVKHRTSTPSKSRTPKGLIDSFAQIQQAYDLTDPEQIQMRILWFNLQQLILVAFPGTENAAKLKKFDRHWKECDDVIKKNNQAKFYGTES